MRGAIMNRSIAADGLDGRGRRRDGARLPARAAGHRPTARADFGPSSAAPSTQPVADIPIKQVVLFSSGVGYFEHYGTVHRRRKHRAPVQGQARSTTSSRAWSSKTSTAARSAPSPIPRRTLWPKHSRAFRSTSPPTASGRSAQPVARREDFRPLARQRQRPGNRPRRRIPHRPPRRPARTPVAVPFLNILTGATIRQVELNRLNDITFADRHCKTSWTRRSSR